MIGVAPQDGANSKPIKKLVFTFFEMQHDFGPALGAIDRFDRELTFTAGLPAHTFGARGASSAGDQGDSIGDDEARVKADTKLPDKL